MTGRRRISSGAPWEGPAGYSRAVVDGDDCWVAGTTGGAEGDAETQARAALGIIQRALAEGGFTLADVVRTRVFVVDPADIPAVLRVHGEAFGAIRPAATLVVVAGLIDPALRVEIEVDARRAVR
jgi:enamine deaminase RidA (YjgF/YER057c/UK114 family)